MVLDLFWRKSLPSSSPTNCQWNMFSSVYSPAWRAGNSVPSSTQSIHCPSASGWKADMLACVERTLHVLLRHEYLHLFYVCGALKINEYAIPNIMKMKNNIMSGPTFEVFWVLQNNFAPKCNRTLISNLGLIQNIVLLQRFATEANFFPPQCCVTKLLICSSAPFVWLYFRLSESLLLASKE